jgi:2-polyprenyl-6-methoxyphenol hydroxylase-like FAD-dependent oxidoreductase
LAKRAETGREEAGVKLLDDAVIRKRYDVVVVGSGIGGLTAGALLAKQGLEVLVVEQHYLPGGACTILRRDGVTFDAAVGMLFGFGRSRKRSTSSPTRTSTA